MGVQGHSPGKLERSRSDEEMSGAYFPKVHSLPLEAKNFGENIPLLTSRAYSAGERGSRRNERGRGVSLDITG